MNIISKIIKGTLLTAIVAMVFCVNTQQSQVSSASLSSRQVGSDLKSQVASDQVQTEGYFVNAVFADDKIDMPEGGGGTLDDVVKDIPAETPDEKKALDAELNKPPPKEASKLSKTDKKAIDGAIDSKKEAAYKASNKNELLHGKGKPAPESKKPDDKVIESISRASTYINLLFNPLIYFFTSQIAGLLNNDFIFGGDFGTMLHKIWIISRNIVNIVFVLLLLFLAVKHIFTEGEGSELKKVLPKFVIMLIAINFSWLASRVILDAANVATNVAFSIPKGVQGVTGEAKKLNCEIYDEKGQAVSSNKVGFRTNSACMLTRTWIPMDAKKMVFAHHEDCMRDETKINDVYTGKNGAYDSKSGKLRKDKAKTSPVAQKATLCFKTLDPGRFSRNNASYHLTYSMMRVQNLGRALTGDDYSKMFIGVAFTIALQIIYLITFGCLFIALVVRAAALWLFVSLSPFIVLFMYLTKDFGLSGSGTDKLTISEFAKWAFAPTKVALVWSIGFIMITTGQTATQTAYAKLNEADAVRSTVLNVQSLFMGMDSLKSFIWLLMTLGIIWVGTFAIFSELGVVKSITDSVNTFGTGLANRLGRAPTWLPIIPMVDPNTGKLKMKSFESSGMNLNARLDELRSEFAKGMSPTKLDEASRAMAKHKTDKTKSQHLTALNNTSTTDKGVVDAIHHLTDKKLSAAEIKGMSNADLKKLLVGGGVDAGKTDGIITKIKSAAKADGKSSTDTKPAPDSKSQAPSADITNQVKEGVTEAIKTTPILLQGGDDNAKAMAKIQAEAEKLLKGGQIKDANAAANKALEDYNKGKLK